MVIDLPVVYENEYDINKLYAKLPKMQPGMYYVVVEADNKKLAAIKKAEEKRRKAAEKAKKNEIKHDY